MSQETMRSDFERLMAAEGAGLYLKRDLDGDYVDRDTALAWYWFEKSRAALAVQLPEEEDIGDTGERMVMDADEVRACIEAAGLKVIDKREISSISAANAAEASKYAE